MIFGKEQRTGDSFWVVAILWQIGTLVITLNLVKVKGKKERQVVTLRGEDSFKLQSTPYNKVLLC